VTKSELGHDLARASKRISTFGRSGRPRAAIKVSKSFQDSTGRFEGESNEITTSEIGSTYVHYSGFFHREPLFSSAHASADRKRNRHCDSRFTLRFGVAALKTGLQHLLRELQLPSKRPLLTVVFHIG
jgi:hypothetical protein